MAQVARGATMQDSGYLNGCRYLLHDRDQKFCREFRETLAAGGVECTPIPARSPNLNAHAERWVRSIKEECLSKLILFGETSLRRVVSEYLRHYHGERNHQGKDNLLLFPASAPSKPVPQRAIRCQERLGGLLKYFYGKVGKVKADVAAILNFFSRSTPQIEADHLDAASVVAPIGGMRKGGFSGAL